MAIDDYYTQTITRPELLSRPGWTLTLIRMLFTDEQQIYPLWQIERYEQTSHATFETAKQAEAEGWADDAIEAWRNRLPAFDYTKFVPTTQEFEL